MYSFPERLRKLRKQAKLSQSVLSELCGLHPDAVRRYENRTAIPSSTSLVALADYFEVSIDYLSGRADK